MAQLTDKQRAFVEEYLIDLDATKAAKRAGYSKRSAGQIGNENLKKPKIKNAIAKERDKRQERTRVTQDMVIEGLLKEAQFHEEGTSHSARISAWKALGEHLGLFVEQSEGKMTIRIIRETPDTE